MNIAPTPFLTDENDELDDILPARTIDSMYAGGWPTAWSRDLRNEVRPGLWIGGLDAARAVNARTYDLIVNLSGVSVPAPLAMTAPTIVNWPISDSAQLPDLARLWSIAKLAATTIRRGRGHGRTQRTSVLIHCAAGINRSALLTACVVMLLDKCDGTAAIRAVRTARQGTLENRHFAEYVAAQLPPGQKPRKPRRPRRNQP